MVADSVELRELRVFLVLADELHFGRTAERLRLTAPRVSQTIATLERRVGGRLFDRTSRRVTLTERGLRLQRTIAGPCADLLAAVTAASTLDADVQGELRLGLFGPASGGPRLPEIMAVFERRYPGCTVQISEVALADCLDALRRGQIDLLATRTTTGAPDLTVGPVMHVDDRVLVVATDHPLAGLDEVSVEVLGDHAVAGPAGWTPEMEATVIPLCTPAGRPVVRTVRVTSMAATYAAVARGDIVHLSTASTRAYSSHPGVTYVRVPDAPRSASALVWRTGGGEDARVAAFVAVAEEVLDTPPVGRERP